MTAIPQLLDSDPVRLGSLGWSNPAWLASFYPADMPEEWRLTYFNTQFNCVFLERVFWRQASQAELAQWYEDTHEKFLFLLEGEALPPPAELKEKVLMLRSDDVRILWFSRDTSLKELAAALSGNSGVVPRFLISRDGDLGQLERVATLLEVMGL
jgi:hypothetical protein